MENKKKFIIFTIGLLLVMSIFSISFYFTIKQLEKNDSKIYTKEEETIKTSSLPTLIEDSKIELYLKDKNGNMKKEKEVTIKDVKEKIKGEVTLEVLQEYYQKDGYFYRPSLTNDKVLVFEKRFIPDKFYISVDDDDRQMNLCVYKANKEGKLLKVKSTSVKFPQRIRPEEKELYIRGYGGEKNEGFTSEEEAEEFVRSTFQS